MKAYLEILSSGYFLSLLTSWYTDTELQAIFLAGLCVVGAWVVLTWILKLVKSLIWFLPLLIFLALITYMPSFRLMLAEEFVPRQISQLMTIIDTTSHNLYRNQTLM